VPACGVVVVTACRRRYGGLAATAELLTGTEATASGPVRRILLRG
jgi:hypothetical protein